MFKRRWRTRTLSILVTASIIAVSYFSYHYFFQVTEEIIGLPQPELTGEHSLEECLVNLREVRDFKDEPLSIKNLSQILWAAQGITDPVLKFRTTPSAGALYPLEIYAVVGTNGIEGLEKGVYHYLSEKHVLVRTSREDLRPKLASLQTLNEDQRCVEGAPVSMVVTAVYERTMEKYLERGTRYVHLEAGHVAQNIYLQATALGLGATMIISFDENSVQTLLGSPKPLFIMPLGKTRNQNSTIDHLSRDALNRENLIKLPSPCLIGETPLEEAIIRRRSIREYGPGNLTLSQLAQILFAAGKILPISKTHSVEIYLCIGEVSNLSKGVYHFIPHSHSLERILEEDVREKLYLASGGELYPGFNSTYDWVKKGKVCLVLTALYNRTVEELGYIGERVAQLETGMMTQNIGLQVATLKLGTVTVGAFLDHLVLEALSLPNDYTPLFLMPIGPRK